MPTEEIKDNVLEIDELRKELDQVRNERDQYKQAYEQLVEQNANVWGLYSNTIDYVVAQTQRKQK